MADRSPFVLIDSSARRPRCVDRTDLLMRTTCSNYVQTRAAAITAAIGQLESMLYARDTGWSEPGARKRGFVNVVDGRTLRRPHERRAGSTPRSESAESRASGPPYQLRTPKDPSKFVLIWVAEYQNDGSGAQTLDELIQWGRRADRRRCGNLATDLWCASGTSCDPLSGTLLMCWLCRGQARRR